MFRVGNQKIDRTVRARIAQVVQGARGNSIAASTVIAEPATPSGVVATATFNTRLRKILGMSAALRNVGNILAWTMHGLPPFAIALLSSFYACADPILVTRDAKVSEKTGVLHSTTDTN